MTEHKDGCAITGFLAIFNEKEMFCETPKAESKSEDDSTMGMGTKPRPGLTP